MTAADASPVTAGQPAAAPAATDLSPILDPAQLVVARLAPGWRPPTAVDGFSVLIDDGAETTLVCTEDVLTRYVADVVESEPGWRRITFPAPLPWELVGFLADVAGRLAAARIPLAAMAGFSTDHVLVRAAHADLAVAVLRGEPAPPPRPGAPG